MSVQTDYNHFPDPFGDPGRDRRVDAFDELRARRVLFLRGPLDDAAATRLSAELLTLDALGHTSVSLLVNSPGGPLGSVFAVTDTIALLGCPVATTCTGQALGTAAAVLAAGTGQRRASPSARLSLRLPAEAEEDGAAHDVIRRADHVGGLQRQLVELLAARTGQAPQRVRHDLERGDFLAPPAALAYGLIDGIAS